MELTIAGALGVTVTKPKKPRYSAAQVKEYLIKTNQWPAEQPKKTKEVRMECPCCDNGVWKGRWERTCFRCKGKGYLDMEDVRRFTAHTEARNNGTTTTTFQDYERQHGINKFAA